WRRPCEWRWDSRAAPERTARSALLAATRRAGAGAGSAGFGRGSADPAGGRARGEDRGGSRLLTCLLREPRHERAGRALILAVLVAAGAESLPFGRPDSSHLEQQHQH